MKLTIDIDINTAALADEENSTKTLATHSLSHALTALLKYAKVSHSTAPLEAHVCAAFKLNAQPDYPIAALSAHADEITLGEDYWFRADPVHLVMQRDAFSLGEDVPLNMNSTHAEALIQTLNQQFKEDGLQFILGKSGAWYLKLQTDCIDYFPVSTTLPRVAIGQNVHPFMPQGNASRKWRTLLNEIQMLLHEHPVNLARESSGALVVNSIWLSGGGVMPTQTLPSVEKSVEKSVEDLMFFADNAFYKGLARFIGAQYLPVPPSAALLQEKAQYCRVYLPNKDAHPWLSEVLMMLKTKKISVLTLNIGCYEQTLVAILTPRDLYQFWRKTKSLRHFFNS